MSGFAVALQPFWTQHLHNYPQNTAKATFYLPATAPVNDVKDYYGALQRSSLHAACSRAGQVHSQKRKSSLMDFRHVDNVSFVIKKLDDSL